jgi:hypothetical protein
MCPPGRIRCPRSSSPSTFSTRPDRVTRIKSGTCAFFYVPYLRLTTENEAELIRGCFDHLRFGQSAGVEAKGASCIRGFVDTGGHSIRTVGASRVLQPPRFCASGCSAEGRSATRPDPQRSHGRTRWAGQPAWGSGTEALTCPPGGSTATGGKTGEERRHKLRLQLVRVRDGRCSRKAGRPSFFLGGGVPSRVDSRMVG